jgi:hypothetical protein
MATNDFIVDVVQKLTEDNMEYVVISLQKGKEDHKANAYFNINTEDGANMLLATANHIFEDENVSCLLTDDLYSSELDDDDSDAPNVEDVWPDQDDGSE